MLMLAVENHIDVGCQCQLCLGQRAKLREQAKRSILNPKFSSKCVYDVLIAMDFPLICRGVQGVDRCTRLVTICLHYLQDSWRKDGECGL